MFSFIRILFLALLTEIEEGLPLVPLSGELVCTHELFKLSLGHMLQDVLELEQNTNK